jgi:L-iditol 2-dehydrogenase
VAGKSVDGYLRDFVVAESQSLFLLPDHVRDSEAIFVDHTALALATIVKLDMQKSDHIVIIGAGILGLILAQLALYYQTVPILVDSNQQRLDMAAKMGIYYTINYVESDPYKKIVAITGGRLSENIVLIGSGGIGLSKGLSYCMRGGSVVVMDMSEYVDSDASIVPTIVDKQVNLYGVSNAAKHFMQAINMIANKTVTVAPFVSKQIKYDQVGDYLSQMADNAQAYIKVVVKA